MIIGGNGMPKIEIHQTAIIGHALRPFHLMENHFVKEQLLFGIIF